LLVSELRLAHSVWSCSVFRGGFSATQTSEEKLPSDSLNLYNIKHLQNFSQADDRFPCGYISWFFQRFTKYKRTRTLTTCCKMPLCHYFSEKIIRLIS